MGLGIEYPILAPDGLQICQACQDDRIQMAFAQVGIRLAGDGRDAANRQGRHKDDHEIVFARYRIAIEAHDIRSDYLDHVRPEAESIAPEFPPNIIQLRGSKCQPRDVGGRAGGVFAPVGFDEHNLSSRWRGGYGDCVPVREIPFDDRERACSPLGGWLWMGLGRRPEILGHLEVEDGLSTGVCGDKEKADSDRSGDKLFSDQPSHGDSPINPTILPVP